MLATHTVDVGEAFAANAASLLDAARDHDARRVRDAVGRMSPDLERFVRQVLSGRSIAQRFGGHADVGDVVQAVLARMIENPPSRPTGTASPTATVLAWVKRVAVNQAIDLARRAVKSTPLESDNEGGDPAPGATSPTSEDQLSAASELDAIERVLSARYPSGARLIALQRVDPDLTDEEIAVKLGTSKDNVQQIRCRVRRVLGDSLSAEGGDVRRDIRRG